jgi:outer membrane protein assembly factor BamB
VEEVEGTPVMLVATATGAVNVSSTVLALDMTSGETLWQTDKVKGQMGAVIPIYKKNLVVLVNAVGAKAQLDLLALNLASGQAIWESKIEDKADLYVAEKTSKFFPKFDLHGHAEPTVTDDAIYFAYSGLHKVDLATGKVIWKLAYDVTEKSFARTNASPLVTDTMVFTSGKGVLRGFDKQTGALKWTSSDFGTGVAQMEFTDSVLYGRMGGVFQAPGAAFVSRKPIGVVALDPASGQVKWKYEGAHESVTNMLVLAQEKAVMLADAKHLIGLSTDGSGKVKEAFKVPLEFKAKGPGAGMKAAKIGFGALRGGALGAIKASGGPPAEPPVALVRRENGLVVIRGTQNLLGFDPVKKEIAWSTRVEPPGLSTFNKIATIAAFAMVYTAQTAQAASTYYGTSENDWANANRRKTVEQWDKAVAKRYHKTSNTADYVYMLSDVKTSEGKGPGIVGVNLSTGEQEKTVYFGDREPEYVADEIDGVVFRIHKGGKTITASQVQ